MSFWQIEAAKNPKDQFHKKKMIKTSYKYIELLPKEYFRCHETLKSKASWAVYDSRSPRGLKLYLLLQYLILV